MDRKIIWAEASADDLDSIADYIAKDSPGYASMVISDVLDAARSLKMLTERGRKVPELGQTNIRETFVHSYRLVYRMEDDNIAILTVIHGRRLFKNAWSEKARYPQEI